MRLAIVGAAGLVAAALLAPPAAADGLPVVGIDVGGTGVEAGAGLRYVTFTLERETVLARVEQDGGRVTSFRTLRGRFTIPAVAYDGSAAGLASDGRTLVLVRPRRTFPQATTRFAVLSTPRLRLRKVLDLRGDFSFDAVSPDGRWLYLVQYTSPNDPTRYLVRLYDLESGRMLREPIIDPREVGDVMRGQPVTRAASLDGRWAYTLYDGAGGHPFVHALDTVGKTARCIDLHGLRGYAALADLRLSLAGRSGEILEVHDPAGDAVARIDTQTFELLALPQAEDQQDDAPAAAASPGRGDGPPPASDHGGRSWPLLALAAPVLALFGTAVAFTRTHRNGA
jgi:hypothetical protein